jgi:hypothetical protein
MAITFKREQTMLIMGKGEKAFTVHRDGQLIGWAYQHPVHGWRCVSRGPRARTYYWQTKEEASAWLDKSNPA